jgi:hypothetical protein
MKPVTAPRFYKFPEKSQPRESAEFISAFQVSKIDISFVNSNSNLGKVNY